MLPSGADLASYPASEREWIKHRVEVEQEARHAFLNQLLANEQAKTLSEGENQKETTKHAQMWGGIILLVVILAGAVLTSLGLGFWAIALVAVVMVPPIAVGIVNQVKKKIQEVAKMQ